MKILIHCVYYPPEVGGLESHVAGLAEGLAERGAEVRVITSRSRPDLPLEESAAGIRIRRIPLPSRTAAGWARYALASIPATRRWARSADLVHAQSFASILPAGVAARSAGRPWVASFHTSHFLVRSTRPAWIPVLAGLVRWPDHAFAASEEIRGVAENLGGGRRVEALTNGVDTVRFRPPGNRRGSRPPTLVVPRRLVPKNGVEYFVRALPEIRRRVHGVRARLIGDGPERERLEMLARELRVEESLEFVGARPHAEMPELLGSGDLAIFPSLMEATSVAALEAMACGLPVVATAVGGLAEIVDEEVGTLVPPADPDALARAVATLLADADLRKLGAAARARVTARWSNDRLVERHLEVYGDLLAGRRVAEPSRPAGGG